jgi:pectin methylesterase-like acyl-CoA thioesterase
VSTEFLANTTTESEQWQPSAATLSASSFVVVWTAIDAATSRQNIEGQRFVFRGL